MGDIEVDAEGCLVFVGPRTDGDGGFSLEYKDPGFPENRLIVSAAIDGSAVRVSYTAVCGSDLSKSRTFPADYVDDKGRTGEELAMARLAGFREGGE